MNWIYKVHCLRPFGLNADIEVNAFINNACCYWVLIIEFFRYSVGIIFIYEFINIIFERLDTCIYMYIVLLDV